MRIRIHTLSLMMVLSIFSLSSVLAQTVQSEKQSFRVVTLTQGLQHPWSLAFLPDGRLLITERAGRLRIVQKDFTLDPKPISGLPKIIAGGQGGLFDVVLHPQYSKNGWIYFAYSEAGKGGWGTALARGKLVGHQMTDVQVLFSMEPKTAPISTLVGASSLMRQAICISPWVIVGKWHVRNSLGITPARSFVCTTMAACPKTIHL